MDVGSQKPFILEYGDPEDIEDGNGISNLKRRHMMEEVDDEMLVIKQDV